MICRGPGGLWSGEQKKIVARSYIETDDQHIINLAKLAGWEIIDNTPPPAIGAGEFNGGELAPHKRGRRKK